MLISYCSLITPNNKTMLLPTMAPKCLPLELLFEIVPFIPAEKAVPNALSSCWLLHKLLLPRVIKWQEQLLTDLMSLSAKVDNLSAKVDNLSAKVDNLSAKVDNLEKKVDNLSAKVDNLSAKVDNLSAKVDNLEKKVDNHSVKLETIEKKMGETTDKAPNEQKERGNGHKAVMGAYNENNGTIEVPLHGYNVGKAIVERILNTKNGTVLLHGMREPISLAKAVEIGFFDNLSLTVVDPNTTQRLFLDEALKRKVLDSNGRLQCRHRQLTLGEANRQRLVRLEKSKPTGDKKIIKLESDSSNTSIQPDKTSMVFGDFTSMVKLINDTIFINRNMERDDLFELLLDFSGPVTRENALDTPNQLEAFVAKHCPSVRIESVGKGNGAKKSFHWNSADDQIWKVGLDEMANGEHSTENSRKKVKAIKRKTEKSADDQSSA